MEKGPRLLVLDEEILDLRLDKSTNNILLAAGITSLDQLKELASDYETLRGRLVDFSKGAVVQITNEIYKALEK